MKARYAIIILIALLALAACDQVTITGSGNVVESEESFTGFDRVEVEHSFRVTITQGEEYQVTIRVDDNLVDQLDVRKSGSTLTIGLEPARSFTIFSATMQAEIVMPELKGVGLSGNSRAMITGFASSDDFEAGLSGSSELEGDIEAGDTRLGLSGSSQVVLSGSGEDLTIDASGSSDLDLSDFTAGNADIDLSGASTATVNISGTLDVSASGSSDVYYLGDPTMGRIDTSGSSSVTQR
jgi:hypothetical protein